MFWGFRSPPLHAPRSYTRYDAAHYGAAQGREDFLTPVRSLFSGPLVNFGNMRLEN